MCTHPLFFSVFFLFPEVESCIDAKCPEGVSDGKVRLAVVVGMHDQGCSYKVFSIVIDYAHPGYQIEVDVLYPTFVLEIIVVYFGFLVADARKQG